MTFSEVWPAIHLKTCKLAKHKSLLSETNLFPFFFVFWSWWVPDPPPLLAFGPQRERIQRGKCQHSGTHGLCLGCWEEETMWFWWRGAIVMK